MNIVIFIQNNSLYRMESTDDKILKRLSKCGEED